MKSCALILITLLAAVFLAGCQATSTAGNYKDDLGRNITINEIPKRIISLSPSNTELAYAVGLQDRLIGVTTFCNYPEDVKNKPKVSEFSTVDIEKVVSLKPDLLLADSIHKATIIPAFEKLNISVLAIDPKSLANILDDITLVGKVTGNTKEAAALVSSLQNKANTVTDKTAKLDPKDLPRVFFLTWHDPLWTAGSNTLINEIITKSGGTNIASDLKGHSQIDLESVIQRNPQIIVVMSSMGDQDTSYNYIMNEPRFKATDALKNNLVFKMDSDIIARTTPRSWDALQRMAKLIHPELFK
jgi:iron complex transport system substrate-binding protein